MKSPSILVATCFLGCAVLLGQSSGNESAPSTSFNASFEPPLPEVPPWTVLTGNVTVTNETSYSGNYSLKIEATTPPGQVAFNLPAPSVSPVLFVDFELLPVSAPANEAAAAWNIAGAQAGFLQVNASGELYAYEAFSGQWIDTGTNWNAGSDGSLTPWTHFTLRLDRSAGTWDLYANQQPIEIGLGLEPDSASQFVLFGDSQAPVYLDDLSVSASAPADFLQVPPGGGFAGSATGKAGRQPLPSARFVNNVRVATAIAAEKAALASATVSLSAGQMQAIHEKVNLTVFTNMPHSHHYLYSADVGGEPSTQNAPMLQSHADTPSIQTSTVAQ